MFRYSLVSFTTNITTDAFEYFTIKTKQTGCVLSLHLCLSLLVFHDFRVFTKNINWIVLCSGTTLNSLLDNVQDIWKTKWLRSGNQKSTWLLRGLWPCSSRSLRSRDLEMLFSALSTRYFVKKISLHQVCKRCFVWIFAKKVLYQSLVRFQLMFLLHIL